MKIWISFIIILNCYSGQWPDAEFNLQCHSTEECEATLDGDLPFCCGTCEKSFCCDNSSMAFDASQCIIPEATKSSSSTWMLGAIIGGMVAAFIVGMIIHTLIRNCIRKLFKRETRPGEDEEDTISTITNSQQPPSYEDLYTSSSSLPGYSQKPEPNIDVEIQTPSLEPDEEKQDKDETSPPPPSYDNLFFKNIDEEEK